LLADRAGGAAELETPMQRAQHYVINANQYADIEQSQSQQGMVITVRDEVTVAQPINQPQQRHMDQQTKQKIEIGENSQAFLSVPAS